MSLTIFIVILWLTLIIPQKKIENSLALTVFARLQNETQFAFLQWQMK